MTDEIKFDKAEDFLEEILDQHFLQSRKIFLWGDVENGTIKKVIQQLVYLSDKSQEDISLYIQSEGGDLDSEMALIDTILSLRKKVDIATIAIGKCFSAGADIVTCGTKGKRFATNNTSIMFHPCSYDLAPDYIKKQEAYTQFRNKQDAIVNALISKNCGKKVESFKKSIEDGLWLSAKEAIKFGAIDKIIEL